MSRTVRSLPFVLGCVLSAAPSTALDARTINCVPDNGCQKNEGPPSCCVPPPCEFLQELKFARANLNNIRTNMLRFGTEEGEHAEQQWAVQNYQDFAQLIDEASPCPENPFYEPAPLLSVNQDKQCAILFFADFDELAGTPSLEDLHDGSNSCQELVEAAYREALTKQQICLVELYRTQPRTLHERMLQDEATAKARVDELEAQLTQYYRACTVVSDASAARAALDDDLAPLVQESKRKAKKKKKKAKRAVKKSGGG